MPHFRLLKPHKLAIGFFKARQWIWMYRPYSRLILFHYISTKKALVLIFLSNSYFGGGEPPKWTSGLSSGSGLFGSAHGPARETLTWELHTHELTSSEESHWWSQINYTFISKWHLFFAIVKCKLCLKVCWMLYFMIYDYIRRAQWNHLELEVAI